MKVELVSYTHDALNVLLSTKNTRLSNKDDDPATWSEERKRDHLAYMLKTIRSSWEFIHFHFRITDVTRVFTHQLVRHRTGSYAQQSMRVVDARNFPVLKPAAVRMAGTAWDDTVDCIKDAYTLMIDEGVPIQDARGILPNNVLTAIDADFNLRTLSDMARERLCTRTQGEFQAVFREMRARVIEVYPWTDPFLQVHCAATGTCLFENYGPNECPVWFPDLDRTTAKLVAQERYEVFGSHSAAPIAKGGLT